MKIAVSEGGGGEVLQFVALCDKDMRWTDIKCDTWHWRLWAQDILDLKLLRFAAYEEELRAMASQPYFRFTLSLIIQFTFPLFFLLLHQRKVTPLLYTDHHRSKSQFAK